ncbi:MAG: cation diffusion facilitator family transporter [Firmicutes bacterium]|nr:cation diffusion facilitator family transporter [Bacillota bacterium]
MLDLDKDDKNDLERYKKARNVTMFTILINAVIMAAKFVVGFINGSISIISDAIHSLSDFATSIVVIVFVKKASKKADADHNYGHEKIEPIISQLLAIVLFGLGIYIVYDAITSWINFEPSSAETTDTMTIIGIVVIAFSIILKEVCFFAQNRVGKKINSPALIADAWHSRSDSLSSIAVLAGLLVVYFVPSAFFVEYIATLIVSGFIFKVAIQIYFTAIKQLIDKAANKEVIEDIQNAVVSIEGVMAIDSLKTRQHAGKVFVDIEIALDGTLTLEKSHSIAEQVHDAVEALNHNIKHCTVHVNPFVEVETIELNEKTEDDVDNLNKNNE